MMFQVSVSKINQSDTLEALKEVHNHLQSSPPQKQVTEHTVRETFQFGYDYFLMRYGVSKVKEERISITYRTVFFR